MQNTECLHLPYYGDPMATLRIFFRGKMMPWVGIAFGIASSVESHNTPYLFLFQPTLFFPFNLKKSSFLSTSLSVSLCAFPSTSVCFVGRGHGPVPTEGVRTPPAGKVRSPPPTGKVRTPPHYGRGPPTPLQDNCVPQKILTPGNEKRMYVRNRQNTTNDPSVTVY